MIHIGRGQRETGYILSSAPEAPPPDRPQRQPVCRSPIFLHCERHTRQSFRLRPDHGPHPPGHASVALPVGATHGAGSAVRSVPSAMFLNGTHGRLVVGRLGRSERNCPRTWNALRRNGKRCENPADRRRAPACRSRMCGSQEGTVRRRSCRSDHNRQRGRIDGRIRSGTARQEIAGR